MADDGPRPWFRFYNEARNDKKLAHIARATKTAKVVVLGAWVGLLTLANESPTRGRLLLSPDVPFSIQDMAEEIGIEPETLAAIMNELARLGSLALDGETWVVCHFCDRQYTSDISTERTRRFRERERLGTQRSGGPSGPAPERSGNEDGTALERSQNVPETPPDSDSDSDSDSDTDTENESVAAAVVTPRARAREGTAAATATASVLADSAPEATLGATEDEIPPGAGTLSPDAAALFRLVERAGILVTPANSEEYLDILDETGDMHLVELAFREAAATGARPTPKWLRAVLDRCKREGCLPGQWRTGKQATGPPAGQKRDAGLPGGVGPWRRWG